jgi:hypothetical protein
MITSTDLKALIAFAIKTNKTGLIAAMKAGKYPVSFFTTNINLLNDVWNVYQTYGLSALRNVLLKVPFNTATTDASEIAIIRAKFTGFNPAGKSFGDIFSDLTGSVGDFLGGHEEVTNDTTTVVTTSNPVFSPITVTVIAIIGIAAIFFSTKI